MATVTLDFKANVDEAKRKIGELQQTLTDLTLNTKTVDENGLFNKSIASAVHEAAKLKGIIDDCYNPKTGSLDLSKMNKAFKEAGINVNNVKNTLYQLGPTGQKAFDQLADRVVNAKKPIVELTGVVDKLWDSLKRTAMWQLDSNIIHGMSKAFNDAVIYTEKLNRNLNDIRIVTGYSADKMADFAKQANKAAQELSTTTNEYVKGSLIFYQQGLSDKEVIERNNATIKLANTSGETAEDISSYMTSIWNNFEDGSHTIEYYADVISKLGAVSAASNADIAEGMQAFAATANTVGLSYEYASAALTTLVDKTQQSASIVGNSLKTIFARLSSLKMGETLEDGVDLTKYTQALETVGVKVLDANGNLKTMDEILDSLAKRWDNLNSAQKAALAQTVGGVRQYNNLISLMDNYGAFQDFVTDAETSTGFLTEQTDIFAESWLGAKKRIQAAWEELYNQLLDDKFFISLTNTGAKILEVINKIVDAVGGLKTVLPATIALFSSLFGERFNREAGDLFEHSIFTLSRRTRQDSQIRESVKQQAIDKSNLIEINSLEGDRIDLLGRILGVYDNLTNSEKSYIDLIKTRISLESDAVHAAEAEVERKDNKLAKLEDKVTGQPVGSMAGSVILAKTERLGTQAANFKTLMKDDAIWESPQVFREFSQRAIDQYKKSNLNNIFGGVGGSQGADAKTILLKGAQLKDGDRQALAKLKDQAELHGQLMAKAYLEEAEKVFNDTMADLQKEEVDLKKEKSSLEKKAAKKKKEIDNLEEQYGASDKRKTSSKKLNKQIEEEKTVLKTLNQNYQDTTKAINDNAEAQQDCSAKTRQLEADLKQVQDELDGTNQKSIDWGRTLPQLVSSISLFVAAGQSLGNVIDVIKDDSIGPLEKLGKVFVAIASGVGLAVLAINKWKEANGQAAIASAANSLVIFLNKKTVEANTKAKLDNAYASDVVQKEEQQEAASRTVNTVAAEAEKKAIGKNTEGKLNLGEKLFGKEGVSVFKDKLGPALKDFIGAYGKTIASYAGAVTIIAATTAVAIYQFNKQANAVKDAEAEYQKLGELYNKTKEDYEEFSSTVNNYSDAVDSINSLTRGTVEFNEAIIKANESAIQLLNTYDELTADDYIINSDGLIQIKGESLERARQAELDKVFKAQAAQLGSSARLREEQNKLTRQNFARELDSNGDIGYIIANGIVSAVAGAVAGGLSTSWSGPGAIIGGVAGALIGGGTSIAAGINARGQEQQAIESLEKALRDGTSDIFASSETLATYLQEQGITDERLIESLTSDTDATLKQIEALNDNTEAILADRKASFASFVRDDKIYQNSNTKDYITTRAVTDPRNRKRAEEDVENLWRDANQDFWVEYLNAFYGENLNAEDFGIFDDVVGQNYKIGSITGSGVELYQRDGDGWVKVSDISEDLANNSLIDLKANQYGQEHMGEYERDANSLEKMLINTGLTTTDENRQAIVDGVREGIIISAHNDEEMDLSGLTRDEINNIDVNKLQESDLFDKNDIDNFNEAVENWDTKRRQNIIEANDKFMENLEANKAQNKANILQKAGMDDKDFDVFVKGLQKSNKELAKNKELAEEVALRTLKMSNAMTNLKGIFDDNADALKEYNKTGEITAEMSVMFGDISDTMTEWLGVSYSAEEVAANLSKIKKAAEGDEEAIKELQLQAAEKIVVEMSLDEEQTALLNQKIDEIRNQDIEIGASIDDADFVSTVNKMLEEGKISAEQLQSYFDKIGYHANYTSKEVDGPETAWTANVSAFGLDIAKVDGTFQSKIQIPQIEAEGIKYVGNKTTSLPSSSKKNSKSGSSSNAPKTSRYHENNARLEMISKELEKINNLESRAYGNAKLSLMAQKNELLEQEAKRYQALADEANSYLSADAGKLKGYGFSFNEDGTIKNFDAIYNSMDAETQQVVDELVSNYETALNTAIDNTEKAAEAMRQILDNKLAMIQYAVEVKIDLDENDLKILDFLLERATNSADDLAASIALIGQQAEKYNDEVKQYEYGLAEIKKLSQEEVTEDQIKAMQEYASAILDATKALIDLREQAFETIATALEHYNEEIERNAKLIDNSIGILGHYKNIINIIGKDTLGITDEMLRQLSQTEIDSANNALRIALDSKEMNEQALENLRAYREELVSKNAGAEELRLLDEQIKAQEDRVAEASEEWASRWEEAAQVAADAFSTMAQITSDAFSKAMAGPYKSLSELNEFYNKQKELDDLTLDTYQKEYELNKLNRAIQNSIDTTDNVKGKQQLAELQEQILEMQKDGVAVNVWDVEVMQKKYDLYLAQIALEEAQNAKNQVRMRRDMEGNWSYIYTADDTAINGAQQTYEDKLYELEKTAQDYIENMQSLILEKMQEYADEIAGLNLTDEERMLKLESYYETLVIDYGAQLDKALDLSDWITEEFNVNDHELIDSWEETRLSHQLGCESMEELDNIFLQESQAMIAQMKIEYEAFANNVDATMEAAGTSTEDFKDDFQDYMEDVNDISEKAADDVNDMKDEFIDDFEDIVDELDDFLREYEWDMDEIINANIAVAQSVIDLARQYAESAADIVDSYQQIIDKALEAKSIMNDDDLDEDEDEDTHEKQSKTVYYVDNDPNKYEYSDLLAAKQRNIALNDEDGRIVMSHVKSKTVYYDTGGYTGEWGNSGRLAVLHQKELVLNSSDTENFLGALDILHNIVSAIDINAQTQGLNLSQAIANSISNTSQSLDQNVTIHAEFPNATDHNEIEEAFNNLINTASQYANRKI